MRGRPERTFFWATRCFGRCHSCRVQLPSSNANIPLRFLYGSIAADTSMAKKVRGSCATVIPGRVGFEIYDQVAPTSECAHLDLGISRIFNWPTLSRTLLRPWAARWRRRARRPSVIVIGRAGSKRHWWRSEPARAGSHFIGSFAIGRTSRPDSQSDHFSARPRIGDCFAEWCTWPIQSRGSAFSSWISRRAVGILPNHEVGAYITRSYNFILDLI